MKINSRRRDGGVTGRFAPARRVAAAALLTLAGCGAAPSPAVPRATAHPLRLFSANQCVDQLVLQLLPPERIASVTWLSREPGGSLMAAAARAVGTNRGTAEEVLAQHPDLVLTGTFTTPALRTMLKRLGYPLVEVPHAGSIAEIRTATRQVAAAVGEPARGEALIAAMDRRLAALARDPGPAIPVVAWDRTGFAAARGSLLDAILTAAGARNLAAGGTARDYPHPDVEALVATDPALLVEGSADPRAASLGDERIAHPLVRRMWRGRTLTVPQAYYVCGTPAIADAAWVLRDQLRAAARTAPPVDRTTVTG